MASGSTRTRWRSKPSAPQSSIDRLRPEVPWQWPRRGRRRPRARRPPTSGSRSRSGRCTAPRRWPARSPRTSARRPAGRSDSLLDLAAVEAHEAGHAVRRDEGAGLRAQVESGAAGSPATKPSRPSPVPSPPRPISERASTSASPAGVSSAASSAGANVQRPAGTSIVRVKACSAGARSTVASTVTGSAGAPSAVASRRPAGGSSATCRRCRRGRPACASASAWSRAGSAPAA